MMQETQGNKGLVIGIIAVTVLLFGGLIYAVVRAPGESGPGPAENVTFDDTNAPVKGLTGAKVVVRLYEDFQCPACRLAEPGVIHAMQKYADRVLFVWKDFPLTTVHQNARAAALAGRCAQDQNKFWDMHDTLYARQDEWANQSDPKDKFISYAESLGMNKATFQTCYANSSGLDRVAHDMAEATQNAVDQTPTYFINKTRYFGMNDAEWDKALDTALAQASSTNP